MKAALCLRYGAPEVVTIAEVPTPQPRAGEILVRIHATTVSSGDRRIRALDLPGGFGPLGRPVFGFTRPRQPILGTELSGVVEAIGGGVTRFKPGDAVVAFPGVGMACHAEYRCLPENGPVTLKPENLSHEQAAALFFGGTTARDFFRRGGLVAGHHVLINGASGSVGTAAMQLARHAGARITAVCSGANAELARQLGASRVVDYTHEDFTQTGETYDVILDAIGTAPFARSRRVLRPGGSLLLVMASLGAMLAAPLNARRGRCRIIAGPASERRDDIEFLAQLARDGHYTPVVDRIYPFDAIADAHRHADTGHKRGNVVVQVASAQ